MIGLSSPTYDPAGHVVLFARFENIYEAQRRGSVTATLDGGAVSYDSGYSIADQTLRATLFKPDRATLSLIRYLVAYYAQVVVTCEIGAFRAILDISMNAADRATLRCRLLSRLDSGG